MTKKYSTQKALIASVLSLALCFSMLVGTTFAWFTDSVTSAGNIIQTGTLDVSLEHADTVLGVDDAGWTDASTGAIFNYSNWEPGYTAVKYVKIENEGSLDLKFILNIIPNNEAEEVNLADVIEVYMVDGAVAVDRAALTTDSAAYVGTLTSLMNENDGAAHGVLYAKANADAANGKNYNEIYTIALKMSTSAGNEYMGKSVGGGFAVQLLATQLASESDSFNNQYDKDAEYTASVGTADELKAALAAGGNIVMTADVTVDEPIEIPAGVTATLDLNGQTITGTKGRDADNNRIHVIVNNGILTIKDGTVRSAGNDGGSAIYNNAGATLTIEDVTVYGAPLSHPVHPVPAYPSYGINNYGMMTVNGATIKTYHGAIATGDNGVTVINDADIDVGQNTSTGITSYAIYSYGNAQVTVNGGKFAFTKQEVYVNGGNTFCELGTNPIMINGGNYIGTSFSTAAGREYVIKGGTFDKDPSTYVADGYVAADNGDGTWTVAFDGATVSTAEELTAALAAGGKVMLTADIAVDETMTIPADKTVALALNGKTFSNPDGYAIKNNGNLTIEGDGVIEGENRAINNTGKLILTGGSYKGSTGAVFNSIWENVVIDGDVHDSNFDCAVTVTGGNINNCKFDSVEVTGGTFTNCTFANPSSNIVFKGGTFDFDPTAEVDSYGNYNVVNNGDGTWTVVPDYQAYVGEVGYFYFNDAINAATDGDTVTIAKDLTRYDGVEIYNKDITIDLNGKTIEVTYGSIIDGCVFKAVGTSDVIIKNGTLIGKNGVSTSAESTATITLVNVN